MASPGSRLWDLAYLAYRLAPLTHWVLRTFGLLRTRFFALPNILAGRSYINFHTEQFPGGEVRGAINVVPEPSGWLLFSTGMIGLYSAKLLSRRRFS